MTLLRRDVLRLGALGASGLLLRSMLTGVPLAILQNPRRALAAIDSNERDALSNPQFLLLSTSDQGDPLNCHGPGTYDDPSIYHPNAPLFAPASLTIGGTTRLGAKTWTQLNAQQLAKTCFFHHATYTGIHSDEPKILALGGYTSSRDQLASAIGTKLATSLKTVQAAPISLVDTAASYQGQPISPVAPSSLSTIYVLNKLGPSGLTALRDSSLDELNAWLKDQGTPAQRKYVDDFVRSQAEARQVPDQLLTALSGIKNNNVQNQVAAAILLFKMRISPAALITIPFGGDNHSDPGFVQEMADYDGNSPLTARSKALGGKTGVAALADMLGQLTAAGLDNQVTFVQLNVFGRTMGPTWRDGRTHNAFHHLGLMMGSNVQGSVVGGVEKMTATSGSGVAQAIDPASGVGAASGAISLNDSLASYGRTIIRACGLAEADADAMIVGGKTVQAALAV